jgi:hypothetical protein
MKVNVRSLEPKIYRLRKEEKVDEIKRLIFSNRNLLLYERRKSGWKPKLDLRKLKSIVKGKKKKWMKVNVRSSQTEIDYWMKEEKSGRKSTIDLSNLKSIVSEKSEWSKR